MPCECKDIPLLVCTLLFPPCAVFLAVGCTCQLLISGASPAHHAVDPRPLAVLLTAFLWLPGVIHACCVVCGDHGSAPSNVHVHVNAGGGAV